MDAVAHASYLTVKEGKVAKTEVLREWPLLAVDRARDGSVIGVESVGGGGANLLEMLRAAGFRVSAQLLGRLRVNATTAESRELVSA